MKAVKHPIIQADSKMNDTMAHGSLTLYVDTSYRPEHHRRSHGIMVSDFKDLKKGEKVYFHYLSLVDDPQIPPDKWIVQYEMLYAVVRDGDVVPLNDYLFVSTVKEKTESSLITLDKKSTTHGLVKYTNHPDLQKGDEVYFNKICAFENEIEGEVLYVMENRDILKVKR